MMTCIERFLFCLLLAVTLLNAGVASGLITLEPLL